MCQITSYKYINNNASETILFLHGWGCNYTYFYPLVNDITYANILLIDLLGFGKNEKLNHSITLLDYKESILVFLKENKFIVSYIFAHSFGGKLAILLCDKLNVKALFLCAPSIYHKKRGIRYYLKVCGYKLVMEWD